MATVDEPQVFRPKATTTDYLENKHELPKDEARSVALSLHREFGHDDLRGLIITDAIVDSIRKVNIVEYSETHDNSLVFTKQDEFSRSYAVNNTLTKSLGVRSTYELVHGRPPIIPAIEFIRHIHEVPAESATKHRFQPGDDVLFKHPTVKKDKLESPWAPYTVISVLGKGGTSPSSTPKVTYPDIHKQLSEVHHPADKPVQKNVTLTSDVGDTIIWKSADDKKFNLGIITEKDDKSRTYSVHSMDTMQRKKPLSRRQFYPDWDSNIKGKTIYASRQPAKSVPEISFVPYDIISERNFRLKPQHCSPADNVVKYQHPLDGLTFRALETTRNYKHLLRGVSTYTVFDATTHNEVK